MATSVNGTQPLSLYLPPELVEAIAERAAELVEAREENRRSWLNAKGAAEYLACGVDRIYTLHAVGRIPCERDGTRLLFDPDALDAWVRNGGGKRP